MSKNDKKVEVKKSSIIPGPEDKVETSVVDDSKQLESLKRKLIEAGMPADSVDVFTTIEQCEAVLNGMKAKAVVQKVDTLEEKANPVEERQIERQWQSKKNIMMNKWLKEEADGKIVQFLVPLEPNEKPGIVTWTKDKFGNKKDQIVKDGTAVEMIQENGARWYVAKGVLVFVPQSVGASLARRLRLTSEAGSQFLADRVDPATGKAIKESL